MESYLKLPADEDPELGQGVGEGVEAELELQHDRVALEGAGEALEDGVGRQQHAVDDVEVARLELADHLRQQVAPLVCGFRGRRNKVVSECEAKG